MHTPVASGEQERLAPLAAAQQQLFFLQRLVPDGASYNEAVLWRLRGPLNVAALAHSVETIARRHDVFRSRFVLVDGVPAQIVDRESAVRLAVEDVEGLSFQKAVDLAVAAAERPFDLAAGPLLRCIVWRRSSVDHLFLCSAHHIIMDGGSIGVFLDDLSTAYAGVVEGARCDHEPLPAPYTDYVEQQVEWLGGAAYREALTAYVSHLDGYPLILPLPTDFPRPSRQPAAGSSHDFEITPELWAATAELSKTIRATPFALLLTIFQIVLHRVTGQHRLVVGTPVSYRPDKRFDRTIGLFMNTVAIRADIDPAASLGAAAGQTRRSVAAALAHSRVPFDRLAQALSADRDPAVNPVVQAMFSLRAGVTKTRLVLPGIEATGVRRPVTTAKLDLYLTISELPRGAEGRLVYRSDLFKGATIARWADDFVAVLTEATRHPDRAVRDLNQRPAPRIVESRLAPAQQTCRFVHQAIDEQATKTPKAPAVQSRGDTFTYEQLCARMARIAAALADARIGPEDLVAVCADRSIDMIAAPLAVHWAGAAYVPLDPTFPDDRIADVLADARPAAVVASQDQVARLETLSSHPVICATTDASARLPWPAAGSRTLPQQLAYVIYTSGSTGKPKGVGVTHEALSNLLDSMQQVLALTDRDVWVAVTTLAFDIAALEIFLPLLAGAQVVVAPAGTTADGRALGDLLETAHATVMQATPSGWRLLLESGWRGSPARNSPALKSLCGGEALDEALANELLTRCGDVWNVYGPTETTIWSSTWRLPRPVGHILIGEPVARTDLHVLDAMGMPAPPGVAGELCIGGRGLARGYRGRPALTAEKFVPDPFGGEPGARLYRTGDRARRQIDGGITVLGRTDHQVKIRGHRLELGEIDAVLSRHPLVARAAVVAQAYGPGDTRLVAYVQPRVPLDSSEGGPSIALSHNQLASHVRAALPAYAVPSRFVRVARMPLTPNGKIDRESLATTEQSDIVNDDTGASTPTQTQLAAIWTDVLGVSRVGIRTSFFEAGGNSLLAGKVVARIRDRARVDLPLIALFEHPTIESLAALLDRTIDGTADGRRYAPIVPVERSEAGLPLSFAQRRLWFLEQLAPGDPAYHMVAAFRVTGAIDVRALDETLGRVAARHEMLRTRFIAANGEPRQIVEPTSLLSLTVRDLTAWPAAARRAEGARIAEREAIEPFDLAHGPLLRVTLVRMAADDALLIFAMHHIAADGRSAVLLTREISALYAQAVANVPAALPALPIQYGDYAAWQAGAMSSDTAAAQLRYWSKQLAATAATPLFTRREVPETARDGAVVAIGIPADVLRGLETLAQREGTTLFTVLYTCLTLVLSIVTRHDDVPIGTDIGARDQLETEHVIGLFVNQLVLRTPIDNDGDYRAFLQRAWATVQGALANRDVPYERIVEELQPGRASGSGLFQAKLVLQEAEPAQLALAGATVTPVPVARGYAKFDLLVNLAQRDGALVGQIEFRPSVVTARQAEIIVEELRAGLAGIAADAGVTIDSLRRQLSAIGARRLADLEDATERAAIEHFHARAAARPRHRAH